MKTKKVKTKVTKYGKQEDEMDVYLDNLLDEHGITYEAIFGKGGAFKMMQKRLLEKMLKGELTHHLGYEKGKKPGDVEHCRNGYSQKKLTSEDGPMEVEIPRDRAGSFQPQIITKGERRFKGFDQRIIGMYAGGMTLKEIQNFLEDQYEIELSTEFISTVTDSINEEVKEWQQRPLESTYAVVFFDALRVKIRDEGVVQNKAVYLALGVRTDGSKEVLGIWIEQNEGAKFWMKVMNDLRHRGVGDILIAVVDGLKGFPEAIRTIFPQTEVQTCIVHLIRYSLSFCGWKERKQVAAALKKIYQAPNAEVAAEGLREFEDGPWGEKFPMIPASWKRHWEEIIPFFSYSPEVRKMIYTTNAIESLHMQIRKVIKNRGHFPNDESATKLIYLALRNIEKAWIKAPVFWMAAAREFTLQFGDRFKQS